MMTDKEIKTLLKDEVEKAVNQKQEKYKIIIKYFLLGFMFLNALIVPLFVTFPNFFFNELFSVKCIQKSVYASVQEEFRNSGDLGFRDQIINERIKSEIGASFVETTLPSLGINSFRKLRDEFPEETWDSLLKYENRDEKIEEFVHDDVFFNALKDKYYSTMIVLYESAAKVDQDEHIKILKDRTKDGVLVDISGLGLNWENKPSSCRNTIVKHDKKQLIILLPDIAATIKKYPDICDKQKVEYKFLKCQSSVFPRVWLSLKVNGRFVHDIELIGVERPADNVSRFPSIRITRAISDELELPYATPRNSVSATGKLYIEEASYD